MSDIKEQNRCLYSAFSIWHTPKRDLNKCLLTFQLKKVFPKTNSCVYSIHTRLLGLFGLIFRPSVPGL